MILIIGITTRYDRDWVPFEIIYAVDTCGLPLIAAYPDYIRIMAPADLHELWPKALQERIDSTVARVIHMPFKQAPLADAVSQFNIDNPPTSPLAYYSREAYSSWGLI